MSFEVMRPSGEHLADSWNIIVSNNPDRTDGPVVFLRTSSRISDKPLEKHIEIRQNQSIFVPIIKTAINKLDDAQFDTETKRRSAANRDIDDGDNPPSPNSITIDGRPIVDNLQNFRIESPEFNLAVQRTCELEEVTYTPGSFPTVAAGYCLLIRSLPARNRPYIIHVKSRGSHGFSTEAIYNVQVN